MSKFTKILSFMFCLLLISLCQPRLLTGLEWEVVWGGIDLDEAWSIRQTSDGGFIIAGTTKNFGAGNNDVLLLKLNQYGEDEWFKVFGGSGYDEAFHAEQTSDGGYIIVGLTFSFGNGSQIYLIKTYANGEPEWQQYWGSQYDGDRGRCVKEIADGYIITGRYAPAIGQSQIYACKINLTGSALLWEYFGTPGACYNEGCSIRQTQPEGGFIIAGGTCRPDGFFADATLVRLTSTGTLEWVRKYGSGGDALGEAHDVVQITDGYIAVGQWQPTFGSTNDFYFIKTDQLGLNPITKTFGGSANDEAYAVDLDNDGCVMAGRTASYGAGLYDFWLVKTDINGNTMQWNLTFGGGDNDDCFGMQYLSEGSYIMTGWSRSFSTNWDVYTVKTYPPDKIYSNESLALAYNGNRHLVRKEGTSELHLVYTSSGRIQYCKSLDGGTTWGNFKILGRGKFPAVTLSSDNLPVVIWTDDIGGLWYRRQTSVGVWGTIYHLYAPWNYWQVRVNAPPSIVITPHPDEDSVHILGTLHNPANGPTNWVAEYSFRIDNPTAGSFSYIEGGTGPQAGSIRSYPSISRSNVDNSLHAVWQRADTICYATREIGQEWNNWGDVFDPEGHQSAHPFVETYGDSVFVVWQHIEPTTRKEDVYRAANWVYWSPPQFTWFNLSQTPNTPSFMPVNAGGPFTVFADFSIFPPPDNWFEIYYNKVDPEHNISQTPSVKSFYPHSAARFTWLGSYLYTAWLEGNNSPYEVRFKRLFFPDFKAPAYLSSPNGYETPSPYLIARDSFVSEWPIPVDVGYETITYQLPLEPGYRYRIRVVAYHESSGQWKEWVKIDNHLKHLIKYNAYEPETLEFWVPPVFYKDGVIDVLIDRITGLYAGIGPIWVYQYEYEEGEGEAGGGPMAQESHPFNSGSIAIFPNPFKEKTEIRWQIADVGQGFSLANSKPEGLPYVSLKIYDVAGRLVKSFNHLSASGGNYQSPIIWSGEDENGRNVSAGIYFLTITNADTKKTSCHKIIKVK